MFDDSPADADFAPFLDRAMRYCAAGEKCESDLREKFRQWGVPDLLRDRLVEALRRDRFLDDARYAQAYANDSARLKGWGRQKIRAQLRAKRLPDSVIERALAALDDTEIRRKAHRLARAKFPRGVADVAERQRAMRFLLSRGFESDIAAEALRDLVAGRDEPGFDDDPFGSGIE